MPAPEVISYVQRLRSQGYSSQQIRAQLITSGVSPIDADSAISSRKNLVIISGISCVAVLIVAIIIISNIGPAFTLKTLPASVEVKPGGSLSFSDQFVFERDVGQEISLRHELVAPATGNSILSSEQIVDALPQASSKIKIPETLPPGRYVIKTTADAEGHTAESSFSFKVIAGKPIVLPVAAAVSAQAPVIQETYVPPVVVQECNDFDPCTNDKTVDGACVFELMAVCCGDYVCDSDKGETTSTCSRDCATPLETKSTVEIITEAQQLAPTDSQRAALLCGTLAQKTDADQCYDFVARDAGLSTICSSIADDKPRDSCYLYFAINKKEFDVCTSIANPNLQSSCYSFKNLAELQASQTPA